MGLIACKECKADISDTAKSCPKCGAKLPTSIGKKILYGIGLIVVVLVAAVLLTPKSREQKEFEQALEKLEDSTRKLERLNRHRGN